MHLVHCEVILEIKLEIKASASIGLVTVVEKVYDVTRIGAMHLKQPIGIRAESLMVGRLMLLQAWLQLG
jgi:hypothetical protein